jgi:benzoate/toluate 1,2-dioxygenase beta subunit
MPKPAPSTIGIGTRGWPSTRPTRASGCRLGTTTTDSSKTLVENPQAEISLIYYARRSGLEDRVFRIETERSSASTPEPRTSHNISNVEILSQNDSKIALRFN